MLRLLALAAFSLAFRHVCCLDNGLALTPPMGWTTGERFTCNVDCYQYPDDCISESLVKSMANTLTNQGYRDAGYVYVYVGDCWQAASRDQQGRLQANSTRFPSGIQSLVQYLHDRKLKLGLYLEAGNTTSHGYPGSEGHLQTDAQTLADWGVDMVTLDAQSVQDVGQLDQIFPEMGQYLSATGRKILYSCYWPVYQMQQNQQINLPLISKTCNMFKTHPDMKDSWDYQGLLDTIKFFGDTPIPDIRNFSRPGSWNDVNQVMVGNYGLSWDQQQTQMAVWTALAAPLFVTSDLRRIKDNSRALLLNARVRGIDQDPMGAMGFQHSKLSTNGQVRIWRRDISPKGSFALAFNYDSISGGPAKISVLLSDLGFTTAAAYNFTDTVTGRFLGTYLPWYTYDGTANPQGAVLINATALL